MMRETAGRIRSVLGGWEGLPLLFALLAAGMFATLWGRELRSGAFLIGDCPYYASAAVSLWTDGDLDLKNQLRGGLAVHGRQVALGPGGEWYPKHPILLPLLSLPFYVLFGVRGFLLFNLLVLTALAGVLWSLCRRHVSSGVATAATTVVLSGTFLRAYVYNYSPDLLSALLVLWGLLLALKRRSLSGGLLLGVSVMAKVTNLFSAALILAFLVARPPRREAARWAVGLLPGLLALAAVNLALFGGPTISGYDRTLVLENGEPITISHRGFFDLPLLEGLWGQIFSSRVGLLPTSPVLLLALPGFVFYFRRDGWEALLFLSLFEFTLLFFSTYRWWATSHYGNRFLMVPVCLSVVPIAFALHRLRQALLRRPLSRGMLPAGTRGR